MSSTSPTVHVTSYAQERLWIVDQLEGRGTSYNGTTTLRLDGALDVEALRGALVAAVNRHGALRTGFTSLNGTPVQVVHPNVPVTVEFDDLSALPAGRAEPTMWQLFSADSQVAFDLAVPPLLRARIVRLGPRWHALNLCIHHIVYDEWSAGLLLGDIAALYDAAVTGEPADLPVSRRRYGDYATQQRRRLGGERLATLEQYWRDRLAGAPEAITLPADRVRPAVQSFQGAWTAVTVPAADAAGLAAVARSEGATPFMVLLAGFAAVLSRYSGEDDVVIGTSVADRGDSDFDDVVGFFVNTVVLRTDLSGRPTFRQLLRRSRDTCLDAYAHQDLPFERVVEVVRPRRTTSHQPVFQVMLTHQTTSAEPPSFGDVEVTAMRPAATGWTQFDLSLSVVEHPGGLDLRLQYGTDLFDRATATRLAGHVRNLLVAAAADPDREVGALPLVTGDERRELLARTEGPGTTPARTAADCVPARIEDQATRTPQAVAVSCGNERITYQELDVRANRLARALRSAGAGPETTVGIAAGRGVDFVVAVQAVWRAGAAFVPIDPAHPADRIGHVLNRAGCRIVLADQAGRRALPAATTAEHRPLVLEIAPHAYTHLPGDRLERRHRPDGLAYVIFTSGTTGTPKGAMVTHDGLVNHVMAKLGDLGMDASDVLAQNGPATFDVVVWQCCAPMLVGGRVHVVPDDALTDPERLAEELTDGAVTVLQAVPSTIGLLLASETATAMLRGLRWLVPTGDALPAELVRRWFAAHPDIPLLNTYGVTECSDDQCHAVISEPPGPDSGPIATIGTPVGGMRAYVLTADLALAPAGVPGELYLAGTGVGRGYRAQPGLTAGRFVPDPFGEPGARLYRTGDVVRLRPAGDLEFFGRSDNQVKVRGFRIEPGEIETALTGHPAVREALVSTHGPAGPERRLVAYVVAETDRVPAAEIRRFASDVLPDYMVPDYVVWLDRFPLTAHGKLDRAALPGPGPASHEHAGGTSVILSDPVEEMVAEVWHQVLGRRPVPGDDFFDSGGNSLLAIGLLSGIRAACDVRLSLADLLRSPTVAGIAATVRSALREGLPVASLTEIPRAEPGSVVPLSFAQERMWVIEQVAQAPALYAVPVTLKLSLAATDEDLRHAVGQLLARHEVLRTRIREQDGRPVQITADTEDTADTVEPPLIVTDLSAMDPDQRDRHTDDLFTVDAQRGVALDQAPLVRVHAVRYAADEIVLQILLHHAITDAWSNDLVVRDLVELVTAAKDRRPPRLPAPPVRYADFAAWQRSQLTAQRSAALLDHWTDRLADAPEMSTFPADRPRPAGQSHRGGRHEFTLPPDLAAAVRRLARSEQATAFMVLATAFGVLLGSASGQDDLVIGIPMSGRDHPQLREVVGLFVNTVPLRMDLSGRPTFTEALRRVRQACLDAYAHADLPFESLIQRLRPRRSLARHPVFQVMLTMQSTPEWSHERRKPIAAPYPAPSTGTAKFDLHLYVVERGGHWNLMIEYATDLFDLATVERLAGGFTVLLGSAIADPGRPISGLNRLTVAERQLIETWATGPVTGLETVPATLPDLLAAGVRASPDGPAIRWDGISLSYRDFQTAVTGLAVRLRELGVGPESVVGVCLDRSADLVIAVHAVVAAGAAYLPLPPSHPVRRLHMLTADAGAAVVICEQSTMDNFAGCAVRLVDAGERAGSSLRVPGCLPDSLAYVIHTSGSTGRPKGVQVGHRAVVNRLSWMQRLFPVGPGDRVLHKTPFGFDVSVWELFWPLAYGAELVVGQPDLHRDPHRLWEVLDEERVALVHFVPAMLGPFLDVVAARGRPPSTLRTIVCSGEQLPARLVNRAYQVMPDVGLHNLYGPTEAAVDVTWHPCAPADVVPIGRPMDNVRAEVLDAEYGRVPPGTRGSLYLGGIQLARGYAGSPGLTASRFVPDPFGPAGSRLYDTGDLARWLPDGTMEFLGRADFQVKVRGMRIEPVEVEVALSAHADVADAVVVADEGRLIAYVVPHAGLMPSQSVLRSHLAGMLPDYQIPARFVVLAQFPLTATGKIDRAALPAPEGHLPHRAATHVPPAGRTQQVLAAIWQQVLGVGPVGADDNFFELGGDSIMSLLVVSRAAEAGVRVAPRQFFDHQTVAELAAVAQDATGRQAPSRSLSRVDDETMARVVAMLRIQDGQADVRP